MSENRCCFAAVGDVHGHIYQMLGLLQNWETKHHKKIDFVLQVGDFEPHRDENDLKTMDAPSKYKKLGDFPQFYTGKATFPYPLYFIGGNHEPYGFLDYYPDGEEIATNFNYLGRGNSIELFGLKIVGVSGIYKDHLFLSRPQIEDIEAQKNKDYIGFTQAEIEQALSYSSADILIMHEWADNFVNSEDITQFQQRYANLNCGEIGNEYASLLIEALNPKLVLLGHMHLSHRARLKLTPNWIAEICCLANVQKGKDALAIFEYQGGEINEITFA